MTSDPAFFASAKNSGPRDDAFAGRWHPPTETWPLVCLATPGEKDQRVLTDMAEGADQRRSDAGCLGPGPNPQSDEGFGIGVCLGDEVVDGDLQVNDGPEHASLEATARELGEEAFDGVEP
jgi:hypothetical protein